MKQLFSILFCACLVAYFTSCTKSLSSEFVPYTNVAFNDTSWSTKPLSNDFKDSVANFLTPPLLTDSFNITSGKQINWGDSIKLFIPPYACSNPTTNAVINYGTIKVEVLALRSKGDFIKHLVSTTSGNYLLETGGSFFVRLLQNGQEVNLSPGTTYKLRTKDTLPKNDMKFFYGSTPFSSDSLFTWLPGAGSNVNGTVSIWKDSATLNKLGYEMVTNKLHWVNCDYFIDSTLPKTRLNTILPFNFTNKNTIVFAVFKNKKIVVRLNADIGNKSFYALNIPINSDVTLVSLSMIDNKFYLGNSDITVTNANFNSLSPQQKTINDIIQFMDHL
jgi:hypothetical protein